MCVGVIFLMFLGKSFVISCIVEILNLRGIPGFLLVGFIGRGGGVSWSIPASCCMRAGSRVWIGFVGSIFAASLTAAHHFM